MNWRRGFFRLWVVFSAVWIIGCWWVTEPIFWMRIYTTDHMIFSLYGQGFDFPPNTERAVVEKTLTEFALRRLKGDKPEHGSWEQYQPKPPPGYTLDQPPLKSDVENVEQQVANAVGNYRPYSWPRLIFKFWGPIVLPPAGLMVACMVAVWVIRGFQR